MDYEQISVRIDKETKQMAEAVFSQLGLSSTDAVRMFYKQVCMQQGLPFTPRITNPTENCLSHEEKAKALADKYSQTLQGLAGR